jgi:hypothetical protein
MRAFKTPSLRNVALTRHYMHNGHFLMLRQMLDFYEFDKPDGVILGKGKVRLVRWGWRPWWELGGDYV